MQADGTGGDGRPPHHREANPEMVSRAMMITPVASRPSCSTDTAVISDRVQAGPDCSGRSGAKRAPIAVTWGDRRGVAVGMILG